MALTTRTTPQSQLMPLMVEGRSTCRVRMVYKGKATTIMQTTADAVEPHDDPSTLPIHSPSVDRDRGGEVSRPVDPFYLVGTHNRPFTVLVGQPWRPSRPTGVSKQTKGSSYPTRLPPRMRMSINLSSCQSPVFRALSQQATLTSGAFRFKESGEYDRLRKEVFARFQKSVGPSSLVHPQQPK